MLGPICRDPFLSMGEVRYMEYRYNGSVHNKDFKFGSGGVHVFCQRYGLLVVLFGLPQPEGAERPTLVRQSLQYACGHLASHLAIGRGQHLQN